MKREITILKYLLKNHGFKTISELAETYEVSTRTIREDIKNIENVLKGSSIKIVRDRKKGILITNESKSDKELYNIINVLNNGEEYYAKEERISIIIYELLISDKAITYDYLMDKTNTSKTTIVKDFAQSEKWLSSRGIKVIKKPRIGITLEYDELTFRNVSLEYIESSLKEFDFQKIYNSFNGSDFLTLNLSMNSYINFITKDINVMAVNNFIKKYENDFMIKFSEDAFIRIFLYILISLQRIKKGKYLLLKENQGSQALNNTAKLKEWILTNNKLLNNAANMDISKTEITYIIHYMMSQNKRYLSKNINLSSYDEQKIVKEFIGIVQDFLCIDLIQDDTLFENILMHISSTIHRLLFDIKVSNPLLKDIKNEYAEIFKACEIGRKLFEEKLEKKLSDDEISFLTMHIAASIEKTKQKKNFNIFRTIIVCSSGIGTSNMLKTRLINEFPSIIVERTCSVEEFHKINKEGIDLVISTTQLSIGQNKSIIYVSPLLNNKDIFNIKKFISKTNIKNKDNYSFVIDDLMEIISKSCIINDYKKLETQIQKYFIKEESITKNNQYLLSEFATDEHILLNADVTNATEAILLSGKLMYKSGCVEKNYGKQMLKSKEILGSNIVISEGIALPHAKAMGNVNKTCMTFITLKNPIKFGNTDYDPVKLVISLAATKSNRHFKALSELIELINHETVLNKLKLCNTQEEFRKILKEFEAKYYKKP